MVIGHKTSKKCFHLEIKVHFWKTEMYVVLLLPLKMLQLACYSTSAIDYSIYTKQLLQLITI